MERFRLSIRHRLSSLITFAACLSLAALGVSTLSPTDLPTVEATTLQQLLVAKAEYLSEVTITSPEDGAQFAVFGSGSFLTLTATAETDASGDTASVAYSLDSSPMGTSATSPDYPVAMDVPVTDQVVTHTLMAVATAATKYNQFTDTIQFSTVQYDPPDPPDPGDESFTPPDSVSVTPVLDGFVVQFTYPVLEDTSDPPEDGVRQTLLKLLGFSTKYSKAADAQVTVTDPFDPSRSVVITAPNVFQPGEEAILYITIADTLERLVGSSLYYTMLPLPEDLVDGGFFCHVDILITTDGGTTFTQLPAGRLTGNPIKVAMYTGDTSKPTQDLDLYMYPASTYQESDTKDDSLSFEPTVGGSWAAIGSNITYSGGVFTGEVDQVSGIMAPFSKDTGDDDDDDDDDDNDGTGGPCGRSSKFTYALVAAVLLAVKRWGLSSS